MTHPCQLTPDRLMAVAAQDASEWPVAAAESRWTHQVRLGLRRAGYHETTIALLDTLQDRDWVVNGRRKGFCWPGRKELAAKLRITVGALRHHLLALEAGGFIVRVKRVGRGQTTFTVLLWANIACAAASPEAPRRPVFKPRRNRVANGVVEVVEMGQRITPLEATKRGSALPTNPSKRKNQEKPAAPAGSASAPPPRRVREAVPEGVPCPPAVAAQLAALFEGIGGRRVARTAAPARVFDRQEREAWADDQLARARALGLG